MNFARGSQPLKNKARPPLDLIGNAEDPNSF